jgi:Cu-Zn family superoxide dismutase
MLQGRHSSLVTLIALAALAASSACMQGEGEKTRTNVTPEKAPAQRAGRSSPTAPVPGTTPSGMQAPPMGTQAPLGTVATAQLQALGDSGVAGTVTFSVVDPSTMTMPAGSPPSTQHVGVRVQADVSGLTTGKHGIHVHEWGDCSAPDGNSAGAHFNPHMAQHGDMTSPQRHPGDFGNIEADASGHARLDHCCLDVPLTTAADGVLGRAVIVHAQPDDLTTQPSGNAGARVACGIIKVVGGDTQPVLAPAAAGQ